MQVNLNQIVASDKPIRTTWGEEEMAQLVDSIKQWGVIQAVKLRPLHGLKPCEEHGYDYEPLHISHDLMVHTPCDECEGQDAILCRVQYEHDNDGMDWDEFCEDGWADYHGMNRRGFLIEYEIVDGHRRIEASRRAGMESIEATIEGMDDQTASVQSLIGNVQREDMLPLDIGYALKSLKTMTKWNNDEIALAIGKTTDWVRYYLTLTEQPSEVKEMLTPKMDRSVFITPQHVDRVQRSLKSPNDKIAVLEKAQSEELAYRQTQKVAQAVKAADELGDTRAKEALIAEPYSPQMHDPEIVKERHERFSKTPHIKDPMYIRTDKERLSFAKKADNEWERSPQAKSILDTVNRWTKETIPQFARSTHIGMLSPEGKRFLAIKLDKHIGQLIKWKSQLESED